MKRIILISAGVFLLLAATHAWAQETEAAPAAQVPAATRSEAECSGFITASQIPADLYVFGGADNDLFQLLRQYSPGEIVFLRNRTGGSVSAGTEYRLVRRARELFRSSRYEGQKWSIRSLGRTFEDVGRIKIVGNTPEGVLAEVTFACGPVFAGDLAVAFQPRDIPVYTPSAHFDRLAPVSGKTLGAITAAAKNSGMVGRGSIVYVNLGENDGAQPGQRYRIFRVFRDRLEAWLKASPTTPLESVGELVILNTQERSSTAIVVTSVREVLLGDGVSLE